MAGTVRNGKRVGPLATLTAICLTAAGCALSPDRGGLHRQTDGLRICTPAGKGASDTIGVDLVGNDANGPVEITSFRLDHATNVALIEGSLISTDITPGPIGVHHVFPPTGDTILPVHPTLRDQRFRVGQAIPESVRRLSLAVGLSLIDPTRGGSMQSVTISFRVGAKTGSMTTTTAVRVVPTVRAADGVGDCQAEPAPAA